VGDRLQALTGGRLGRLVEGTDEISLEVDQASDTQSQKVGEGYEGGLVGSHKRVDGHVNGHREAHSHQLRSVPDTKAALGEWEEKWANGTQQRQKHIEEETAIPVHEVVSSSRCDQGQC
jgi:hypothetical protein